jgi:prolyl-tRNA synthetase
MTHGDDDGLRCPPQIAPHQIVIVPMFRDNDEDKVIFDFCRSLSDELRTLNAFGEPVRVLFDTKYIKAQTKRWGWVKKGAPLIVEVGSRDVAGGNVSVIQRTELYTGEGKLNCKIMALGEFVAGAAILLENVQADLSNEADKWLQTNIARDVTDLAKHFKGSDDKVIGWAEVQWSRPTGAALAKVVEQLKVLKLTMRNVPTDAASVDGQCFFTGDPAVERILIGRAY